MKKKIKKSTTLIFILFVIVNIMYGNEINDEKIEKQNQKDLMTILQYTAQYRFDSNLKVGDKVVYKNSKSNDDRNSNITLQVLKKKDESILIRETFEGNVLDLMWNQTSKKIIFMKGADDEGNEYSFEVIDDEDVTENFKTIKKKSEDFGCFDYSIEKEDTDITENGRNIRCKRYVLNIPTVIRTKINDNIARKITDNSAHYFSSSVPKLIPFNSILQLLNSLEILKNNDGFVKNYELQLIDYTRGA